MKTLSIKALCAILILSSRLSAGNPFEKLKITDKINHYTISCNLSSLGAIAGYKLTDRPVLSVLISMALTIGIGALKEGVWDGYLHRGDMDWKGDFPADIQGAAAGAFFSGMAIVLKQHHEDKVEEWKYQNMAPLPLYKTIYTDFTEPIKVIEIQDTLIVNEIIE